MTFDGPSGQLRKIDRHQADAVVVGQSIGEPVEIMMLGRVDVAIDEKRLIVFSAA